MENYEGKLNVESVHDVEVMALGAWPGLEIVNMGGWLVRFANGITRRANSVWPNTLLAVSQIDTLIGEAEGFYAARKLPARFQICPAAQPSNLDEILSERGYRVVAKTAVQTTSLSKLLPYSDETSALSMGISIGISPEPSTVWWKYYAEAGGVSTDSIMTRKLICTAIKVPAAYAMAMREGKVVAVGSATYTSGWLGIFNIATLREYRRMGAARSILAALSQWGQRLGATQVYLQVMADNQAALLLYKSLSFATGYYYHYREQIL